MLGDIGGYAVDKVKFALELHISEAAEKTKEWEDIWGSLTGPQGGKTYNVVSVKKGQGDGTFLYVFDVWGEAACRVDELDFLSWYPHLDRVDLKVPMPMTPDGQRNYYDFLREVVGGKRSIDLRESPIRQKRGNRDAGGHTLSLGSHKSDFRAHWTLRGSEDGYQEFQLEGSRLERSINVTRYARENPNGHPERYSWLGLMKALLVSAQVELSDLDGLYDHDREAILRGATDVHGVIERKLAEIERQLETLPKDALFSILDALNLRIFGEPPEPLLEAEGLIERNGFEWKED